MDFFDKDNYNNLSNINNLNKKIRILTIELKEYEAKKKNNIYFLKIQNNIFEKMFKKKYILLKKYYIRIIKNAIIIHFNKQKNNELNKIININNNIINSIYVDRIDIFNNIEKKSLLKLKNKYQQIIDDITNINNRYLLKLEKKYNSIINLTNNNLTNNYNLTNNLTIYDIKSNNELFYNYIYYSNLANNINLDNNINFTLDLFISIYLYFNKLKLVNLEFLEYIKYKKSKQKQLNKLYNNNNKSQKLIEKNTKSNELLIKKSEDIKNKYNYIQKYIIIQEKKNLKTQFNFVKNIHELNIRIDLHNQLLKDYKIQVEDLQNLLKDTDESKGYKIENSEQCMICLDDISHGIITKCNHKFHHSCINLYIFNILNQLNNIEIKCPICRQFI